MQVISELKEEKGSLMPIMQRAQDIYGYLPIEVQTMISDATGHPLEEIYGISTFYSMFNLNPKRVRTRCQFAWALRAMSRAPEISMSASRKNWTLTAANAPPTATFSLDACRCIGACGLAPVLMVNDGSTAA